MVTTEELNQIVDACSDAGFDIRVRDVAYVLLCRDFEENSIAYRCFNPSCKNEDEVDVYNNSAPIRFLREYMQKSLSDKVEAGSDISFQELKDFVIYLKAYTKDAMADGKISVKDGIKTLTDISVKLLDKFNVSEDNGGQYVVVEGKYDSICPYCNHEVNPVHINMTKEEAMDKWNLIQK